MYVRLQRHWDSYGVRAGAVALAREMERRHPDLVTAAWWKEERGERVFIDFNQNAPHKTVFGAWSVRARPAANVSAPFRWDELDAIHPDDLTIVTVPERLAQRWRSVGGDVRPAAVARAAARAVRAGSRPLACSMPPGRPSTRRCRTSRPGWRPAGPAARRSRAAARQAGGSRAGAQPDPAAGARAALLRVACLAADAPSRSIATVPGATGGSVSIESSARSAAPATGGAVSRWMVASGSALRDYSANGREKVGPALVCTPPAVTTMTCSSSSSS